MKLYTEEQVVKYISDNFNKTGIAIDDIAFGVRAELTPIELPSDEEIEKEAFQVPYVPYNNTNKFYDESFIKGAKWMKNKIQEGNKLHYLWDKFL